jgi:alkanesulfonate monooxygenase SsuD/methylene tetrahydromethanopterin reductase-like flavin-dependent oxidoreductase (luciferase family)
MGSGRGRGNMLTAARHGLAFCYSLFHPGSEHGPQVIREYRESFTPSRELARPYVLLATNFVCAETNNAALALLRRAQTWQGEFRPRVLGRPALCRQKLEELTTAFGADEVVLMPAYDGIAERRESYGLLAEACGLSPAA